MATCYSVINTEKTILVTRQGNDSFKVMILSDGNAGKEVVLKSSRFQGSGFKYPNDFIRHFCAAINEEATGVNVLLSSEANNLVSSLLAFNRLDS